MPRVRFLKDYDFRPVPNQLTAYKAGHVHLVTTPCAEAAIHEGKAELLTGPDDDPSPARPQRPVGR